MESMVTLLYSQIRTKLVPYKDDFKLSFLLEIEER